MRLCSFVYFLIVPCLFLSGCLVHGIYEERSMSVVDAARFDSECPTMEVVEQMDNQRYRLEGCGMTYVYSCHDRHRMTGNTDVDAVDFLLTAGVDPNAPCVLMKAEKNMAGNKSMNVEAL